MEYRFNEIEKKWQDKWKADKAYKVSNDSAKSAAAVIAATSDTAMAICCCTAWNLASGRPTGRHPHSRD